MNLSKWLRIPLMKNGPANLRSATILEICRSAPGIHAARPQTPFQTFLSRNPEATYADLQELNNEARKLIRIRCMRTTLHIVPVEIAPTLHFSTLEQRLAKCNQIAKCIAGYDTNRELVEQWISERLDEQGYVEERPDEAKACKDLGVSKQTFRLELKRLWEVGEICFQDISPQWNKERRIFVDTRQAYGEEFFSDKEGDPFIYMTTLGGQYFRAFGPATLGDFAWWSGLSKKTCINVISHLKKNALLERYHGSLTYYFYEDCQKALEDYHDSDGVYFLPWEDYSLKAYYQTRFRYGDETTLKRAFNSIGEVKRTIVHRGQIIGVWQVDRAGLPSGIELFDSSRATKKKVLDAIEKLKDAIDMHNGQGLLLGVGG